MGQIHYIHIYIFLSITSPHLLVKEPGDNYISVPYVRYTCHITGPLRGMPVEDRTQLNSTHIVIGPDLLSSFAEHARTRRVTACANSILLCRNSTTGVLLHSSGTISVYGSCTPGGTLADRTGTNPHRMHDNSLIEDQHGRLRNDDLTSCLLFLLLTTIRHRSPPKSIHHSHTALRSISFHVIRNVCVSTSV